MTRIASTAQLVRNELVLLRRLAIGRRSASAGMPNIQRSGLVHGPLMQRTGAVLPAGNQARAAVDDPVATPPRTTTRIG